MTIIPELEKKIGTFRQHGITWSPEDDDTILRYYGKVNTALLRKHVDKSHNSRSAIRHRYNRLIKMGKKPSEAGTGKPAGGASPKEPAQKKKPTSQQAKAPKPNRGGAVIPWSPDELAKIDGCKTAGEAIKVYRAAFPDSERNDNGIKQRWNIQRKLKKIPPVKKPAAVKKAPKAKLPLKMRNIITAGTPASEYTGGQAPPDEKTTATEKQNEALKKKILDRKEEGGASQSDCDKITMDTAPDSPSTGPEKTLPNNGIVTGVRVTQTGGSKRMFGVGEVKRINQREQVALCRFGNGMDWIPLKDLTLADSKQEAKA